MDPHASTPPPTHLFSFTSNSHQKHGTLSTPIDFQLPSTTPNSALRSKQLYSFSKSCRQAGDVDSKHNIAAKNGVAEPLLMNVKVEDEHEMMSASCSEIYHVAREAHGSTDHKEVLQASAEKDDPSVPIDVRPVLSLGSSTKRFKVVLSFSVIKDLCVLHSFCVLIPREEGTKKACSDTARNYRLSDIKWSCRSWTHRLESRTTKTEQRAGTNALCAALRSKAGWAHWKHI